MSEAAKKINIDVGDVLKRGSNEVKMTELNKMGLTKVKVIRHSQVQELISQAVENAIARFIFGAEGRKEHERLMSLIKEKESALSEVSVEEEKALKSEVETLKRQMIDQAKRLDEAKAKVIEETKKEYEILAEKTSLENQLVMQKKTEIDLSRQLQEMTLLVGQLKDKVRDTENQSKDNALKLQELAKIPVLEDEIESLTKDNDQLARELEDTKNKLAFEKQNLQLVSGSVGEKQKYTEELNNRLSRLDEESRRKDAEQSALRDQIREKELAIKEANAKLERLNIEKEESLRRIQTEKDQILQKFTTVENDKKKLDSEILTIKDSLREKDFSLRDLQSKIEALLHEKEELVRASKTSVAGVDSELRRVLAEKTSLADKASNAENTALQLKEQLRDKEVFIQGLQLKNEQLQNERNSDRQHFSQLESQLNSQREANQEARLQNEKLVMKEEIAREKSEALKLNVTAITTEKDRLAAELSKSEETNRQLNSQIEALNQQIAQNAAASQNVAMMEALKTMMADMKDDLKGDFSEKIDKVKMRAGSGGGGGGGGDNYVELDPSVVLKNMFAEKIESNFEKVALDSRKTAGKKDFGKTLDALKSLRGDKKE